MLLFVILGSVTVIGIVVVIRLNLGDRFLLSAAGIELEDANYLLSAADNRTLRAAVAATLATTVTTGAGILSALAESTKSAVPVFLVTIAGVFAVSLLILRLIRRDGMAGKTTAVIILTFLATHAAFFVTLQENRNEIDRWLAQRSHCELRSSRPATTGNDGDESAGVAREAIESADQNSQAVGVSATSGCLEEPVTAMQRVVQRASALSHVLAESEYKNMYWLLIPGLFFFIFISVMAGPVFAILFFSDSAMRNFDGAVATRQAVYTRLWTKNAALRASLKAREEKQFILREYVRNRRCQDLLERQLHGIDAADFE